MLSVSFFPFWKPAPPCCVVASHEYDRLLRIHCIAWVSGMVDALDFLHRRWRYCLFPDQIVTIFFFNYLVFFFDSFGTPPPFVSVSLVVGLEYGYLHKISRFPDSPCRVCFHAIASHPLAYRYRKDTYYALNKFLQGNLRRDGTGGFSPSSFPLILILIVLHR